MKLVRYFTGLKGSSRSVIATIGNFDGVHLGHQEIIRQLLEISREKSLPSTVILFEPQPQEYFSPKNAPARIMCLREKLEKLEQLGIDRVLLLRFDSFMANLSAEEFVESILVNGLGIQHLIIGHDFRFGKGRSGDYHTLESLSKSSGFSVSMVEPCIIKGRRVSSTWLREILARGKMKLVSQLMGHNFSICGRVIHGDKRGRELGFPTININMGRLRSPVNGIFIASVHGLDIDPLPAVACIGTRPMFNGKGINLEVYIIDFDQDVYGKRVRVELLKRIRSEAVFDNIDTLKNEIKRDVEIARQFFVKE